MSTWMDNHGGDPVPILGAGMMRALTVFAAERDVSVVITRNCDREPRLWMVGMEWGQEAPDSPMVGAAAYGLDENLDIAVEQALADARVYPCATCGWEGTCPDEECHS